MPRLADQDLHGLMRGERLLAGLSDMASFKRHPTGTRMGTSVRQLLQSPEDAGMYVPQPFVADHRNILATYHGIGPKAARTDAHVSHGSVVASRNGMRSAGSHMQDPSRRAYIGDGERATRRRVSSAPAHGSSAAQQRGAANGGVGGTRGASAWPAVRHHDVLSRRPDAGLKVNGVSSSNLRPLSAEAAPTASHPVYRLSSAPGHPVNHRVADNAAAAAAARSIRGNESLMAQRAQHRTGRRQLWDGPEPLGADAVAEAERRVHGGNARSHNPQGSQRGHGTYIGLYDARLGEDIGRLGMNLKSEQGGEAHDAGSRQHGSVRARDVAQAQRSSFAATLSREQQRQQLADAMSFIAARGAGARGAGALIHRSANPLGSAGGSRCGTFLSLESRKVGNRRAAATPQLDTTASAAAAEDVARSGKADHAGAVRAFVAVSDKTCSPRVANARVPAAASAPGASGSSGQLQSSPRAAPHLRPGSPRVRAQPPAASDQARLAADGRSQLGPWSPEPSPAGKATGLQADIRPVSAWAVANATPDSALAGATKVSLAVPWSERPSMTHPTGKVAEISRDIAAASARCDAAGTSAVKTDPVVSPASGRKPLVGTKAPKTNAKHQSNGLTKQQALIAECFGFVCDLGLDMGVMLVNFLEIENEVCEEMSRHEQAAA